MDTSQLRSFVGYLVSIHDIGKIEYCFQAKDPEMKLLLDKDLFFTNPLFKKHVRHEKTGQAILSTLWMDAAEDEDASDLFSEIVGAHHQGKNGQSSQVKMRGWTDMQNTFDSEMRHYFINNACPALPVISDGTQGVIGAILLAIMILSDWISSGESFFNAEDWIRDPFSFDKIASITKSFLEHSELAPVQFCWPERFCDLWPKIPEEGVRPLQRETEQLFSDPSKKYRFLLMEAPMGEGKTEAGVYAALRMAEQWGKDGFYLALPTAATANQMVGRMRDLLVQHEIENKVRLLHAMAWLEQPISVPSSEDEADGIANWLAPVRRGLLGQYAVGTVDQAMLAATTIKYGALRLLGLSNKVLIIDEIHSYDAYMSEIIVRLLEWCAALEIPVVMLSATLPPEKKQSLFAPFADTKLSKDYPLITAIEEDGRVREHVVSGTTHHLTAKCNLLPFLNDPALIAKAAVDLVNNGGCICVLMNTVQEAQEVYSAIRQIYSGDLLLFHARFTAARRAEIEEMCLSRYGKDKTLRPKRSILVATQVVEQSLDVDFDAMITAVAPIDLLVQRLGRVHRHDETTRPSELSAPLIEVLMPDNEDSFGASQYVYPECLLKSSIRILRKYTEIRVPDDIAEMVREGYSPEMAPEEELHQWQEKMIKDQVDAGASIQFLINKPDRQYNALEYDPLLYDDDAGFIAVATRLSEPSIRLALLEESLYKKIEPFLKERKDGIFVEIWQNDLAKEILLQSVSVKKSRLRPAKTDKSYIKGDKLLSGVWIVRITDGICRLENGLMIRNDPELGLIIKEGEI